MTSVTLTKAQTEFFHALKANPGGEKITRSDVKDMAGWAVEYKAIQEARCNGFADLQGNYSEQIEQRQEKHEARLEAWFTARLQPLLDAGATLHFNGDPRGATVKITLAKGPSNSFAGRDYCVPGS